MLFELLAVAGGVALAAAAISLRVVKQYERALVFRFGRVLDQVRGPGLAMIVPIADRLHKVNMQIVTMAVPAQEGITRDNVTVKVDAVVYFRVIDPVRAIINVQDYPFAVSQVAQTSLRSVIGKSDLDDLLTNRERLNEGLELMIDNPAVEWGIHIDRVEIKDVALPETMKRSCPGKPKPSGSDEHASFRRRVSCRLRIGWQRLPQRWPTHPALFSCDCSRPSSRWLPRRTPRWCCRSR